MDGEDKGRWWYLIGVYKRVSWKYSEIFMSSNYLFSSVCTSAVSLQQEGQSAEAATAALLK